MKKLAEFIFFLLALQATGLSQNGTYDFLRTDVGARAAALQGSFVSMTNDPNVVFYNPAALTTLDNAKASVGYLKHLLDVNAGSASYAQSIEGIGWVGFGITFIDYGSFNRTDQFYDLGTFGATEFALLAGIATEIDERTSIGGTVKGIYSSIAEYRSTAIAFDAGVLYKIPEENITIGGSILNVGRQLTMYLTTRESLPLDLKIGITKRPEHLPVLLNLDFHKLNESQETLLERFSAFSFGAEFIMSESVRLRAGYDNEQHKELKLGTSAGLAGFAFGGGIYLQNYQFDYAFNSYGRIGGLHRISLGITL